MKLLLFKTKILLFFIIIVLYTLNSLSAALLNRNSNENTTPCGTFTASFLKEISYGEYNFKNITQITFNKDGSKAYVLDSSIGVIVVFDLTTDHPKKIKQIDIDNYLDILLYNNNRDEYYLVSSESKIYKFDSITYTIELLYDFSNKKTFLTNMIISECGNYLYICSRYRANCDWDDEFIMNCWICKPDEEKKETDYDVSIIDIEKKEIIHQIPFGNKIYEQPAEMIYANNKLYVVGNYTKVIYCIDLIKYKTIKEIKITNNCSSFINIIASYDKKKLIVIYNSYSGAKFGIIDTTTNEYIEYDSAVSKYADPSNMAIIKNTLFIIGNNKLYILNTDINEQVNAIDLETFGQPNVLSVSPSNDELFISSRYYHDDIYNPVEDSFLYIYKVKKYPSPNPPIIISQTPTNTKSPTWNWSTGGNGNGYFRYKIDNNSFTEPDDLTSYTPPELLSEGFHTFYVQEQNAFNCWSESASLTIEIDTGEPCSKVISPEIVRAESRSFTIDYLYGDIYRDQKDCFSMPSGSGVQEIQLWAKIPGNDHYEFIDSDINQNIDGYFQYTVTDEGAYYFYSIAIDKAGNKQSIEDGHYDSRTIYVNDFSGYAILAVGAIDDKEGLEPHTLTVNKIYQQLVRRNFTLEDKISNYWDDPLDLIKYYNPYPKPQIGEDEYSTPDRPMIYKKALKFAITEWSINKMKVLPGPLYLILLGHGADEMFFLDNTFTLPDEKDKYVTSSDLKEWLELLQQRMYDNKIPSQNIIIFLGSCHSGSFIDDLSGENIVIITSSSANESSYRGPKEANQINDGDFFMTNIFNGLGNGMTLFDSFNSAVSKTFLLTDIGHINRNSEYQDTILQHPLLEDNSDGEGSNNLYNGLDGNKAKNIILGFDANAPEPIIIAETGQFPEIPVSYDSNLIEFWAKTEQQYSNIHMWIDIKTPDSNIEKDQQIVDLKRESMTFNSANQRFEVKCNDFNISGQYTVFYYAAYNVDNNTEIISQPVIKHVYKQKQKNNPPERVQLLYPENEFDQARTKWLLRWNHSKDPDNDRVMYTLILSKSPSFEEDNTIQYNGLTTNYFFMNLPAIEWDQCDIYWKVHAIDEYGLFHEYDNVVFKFFTNNNNTRATFFHLCVKDTYRNYFINNASIVIEPVVTQTKLINNNGCYYNAFDISESQSKANINITAPDYQDIIQEIDIQIGGFHEINFQLTPLQIPCDINFDNNIDLSDAILFLQLFTGIQISLQQEIQTISGKDQSGLNELIYIFERIVTTE